MDIAVASGAIAVVLAIAYAAWAHIGEMTRLARDREKRDGQNAASRPQDAFIGLTDRLLPVAGTGLGLILTVFVAYSALRNQALLTAEIAINEDGGRIADWEREKAEVRCLYTWFDEAWPADGRPDTVDTTAVTCLARIVADRDTYTEAMLYIEESFFILRRAARDQARWGSTYYREIEYWQSDVSDDPTGLFSFHLLNRYPFERVAKDEKSAVGKGEEKLAAAERAMKESGVKIKNLCVKAEWVRTCLHAVGRFAAPLPEKCDKPALAAAAPGLTTVERVCRAAAAEHEIKRRAAASAIASLGAPVPLDGRPRHPATLRASLGEPAR